MIRKHKKHHGLTGIRLADGREYLTALEAAEVLEVDVSRVHQFAREGRLPSTTLLGGRLLPRAEVERFARERPRKPGPAPR